MKDDKDIKKLFREGMEEAPKSFNNRIMDKLAQEEKANIEVMQIAGGETPSSNFTTQVMKKVKAEAPVSQPLLPWSMAWAGVAACAVLIIMVASMSNVGIQTTPLSEGLHQFLTNSQGVFATLLALALVVIADQLYKHFRQLGKLT